MSTTGLAGGASDDVLGRIRAVAESSGFVRFDRFMEVALYSRLVGYYSRPDHSPFARSGDFYTAAHVHPLFAAALARRIMVEFRSRGSPPRFRVVEIGAGDGTLAAGVLEALSEQIPEESAWEFVLVERSASMKDALVHRFSRSLAFPRVDLRFADSVGADGPFVGVVYANELIDALPCRRLVWRSGAWQEVGVREVDGKLSWTERSLEGPIPGRPLPDGLREGAVLEVGLTGEAFVREVADNLASGCALLLDYGYSQEELTVGHSSGTLVSIRRHAVEPDPLARPGETDLGVFVNFTRARAAASSSNLAEIAYRSMAEALTQWGLPQLLEQAVGKAPNSAEEVKLRLSAKNLLFGFENFHVLELGSPPASLSADPAAT